MNFFTYFCIISQLLLLYALCSMNAASLKDYCGKLFRYALVDFSGSHVLSLSSVLLTWIPTLMCFFHPNAFWSLGAIIMSLLMSYQCPYLAMAFKKLVRLRILGVKLETWLNSCSDKLYCRRHNVFM